MNLPEGSERNHMLPFSEVKGSFLELKVFQSFGTNLVLFSKNSKMFRRLGERFKNLPLEGRPIHGICLINMMMSTLMHNAQCTMHNAQ